MTRFTDDSQARVATFMIAMNQKVREKPTVLTGDELDLRIELVREEFEEIVRAAGFPSASVRVTWKSREEDKGSTDMPAFADGLADLLYVLLGWANAAGIDLAPIFLKVHEANVAKLGGPIREDGKRMKPPGWTPPDVAGELVKQGWTP